MSNDVTLAWWRQASHSLWTRWVEGYAPSPASRPAPLDVNRLSVPEGVPLPGPVSSGRALDYYRRRGRFFRRTRVGVEMWRFKYRGDLDAGWRLVHAAAGFLSERLIAKDIDYVVPAPSSPEFREYSPSLWLGEKLAAIIDKPVLVDLFVRSRLGSPQKELSTVSARRANVGGMFKVKPNSRRKISGKQILLLDDLSRSGYTLAELRKMLNDAGSGKIMPFAFTVVGGTQKGL